MKGISLWRITTLFVAVAFVAMTIGGGSWSNPGTVYGAPLLVSDFTTPNTALVFDFNDFTGAGLTPAPSVGQLDSNQFIVTGMSDGSMTYGDTQTGGDFARGTSTGGVTTGGLYAFTIGTGDNILGVQPAGSDFTAGTVELQIQNNTGATVTNVDINYDVAVFNDQPRSNSFNLSWATGSAATPGTFATVSGGAFTTPEAADASPAWASTNFDLSITGLSLADGEYLFLRWESDDVGGSGSRDEFGINNLSVTPISGSSPTDTTIDLSTYVRIGRYNLPVPARTTAPAGSQLALEVSTVTYNPDTDTLFVLGDEGTSVVQVAKNGQIIDSMTLTSGDFDDPEGLTHVSGSQFVLVEERERQANLFTYVAGGTLARADVQSVKLGTTVGNVGLEGISYDPETGGYILVKEISLQGIFQTEIDFGAGTATNGSPTTENATNLFDPALANLTDIADVYAQSNLPAPLTGSNLLVLSQEDGVVVNIDRTGTISNSLAIASDPDNPLTIAGQGHEGVTMDNSGLLYVVNEQGGGDSAHPQLWVYAPAFYTYTNTAPVAISLANVTTSLPENSDTSAPIQVGTIIISDDALGTNTLSLAGADAASFEITGSGLFLKAGTVLDFDTQSTYTVTVNVDDTTAGSTPDASTTFTLGILDTATTTATVIVSEVAPWSSGNSPGVGADWFEVTNVSTDTIDITGWRMDDSSASFANSVALSGVTSIAPNQSAIFVEGNATTITAFVDTWFGGTLPAGVLMGTYSGSGVGLGTGGDGVNLFDASSTLVTGVTFGASPSASPFATFDNTAGLPSISTLSVEGVNGAYSVIDAGTGEAIIAIGSPGTISVAPVPVTTLAGIAATDATAAEAGQNPGTFTILRTGGTTTTLEVTYIIGGDADAADYTPALASPATVPAGSSQVTITITPVDDALAEAAESVILTLVDSANYDLATNAISATVTIADNDTALADFDLQITEIWPGNAGDPHLTEDWFEIINSGTEAWVSSVAPDLYYDDESKAPADATPILGLTQLDPGERAIVVVGLAADATTFFDVWSPDTDLTGVEIGYTDGAGLGGGGDAVTLWVGDPNAGGTESDFETFPNTSATPGQSYDVELAAFSTVGSASGAVATTVTAGPSGTEPAIGSPGNNPFAPMTDILNEPFDYAELGQTAAFTITDNNGDSEPFFYGPSNFDYLGIFDGDNDGGADFGGDTTSGFNTYTGFDDNHLVGSDIDGGSINDPAYLTWSGLDISGVSNVAFSAALATDDTPGSGGLDPDDFVKFEYRVDGGAWQNLLAFETADDSTSNQPTFLEDTNFDGIGDGTALTSAAQTFQKFFSVSGSTLDLRLGIRVEAGFEDIGIDTIVLTDADNLPLAITALNPVDEATNVPVDIDLTVTFSKNVQKGAGNVDVKLSADDSTVESIDITSSQVTISGNTVTISLTNDLQFNTGHYVQINAGAIEDTNGNDFAGINDSTTWNFTTQGSNACSDPATLISAVQGSGSDNTMDGSVVSIEGVVVGDYQGSDKLNGFFVQEEDSDADGDAATSEGIFIYEDSASPILDVNIGDLVRVIGTVDENFGVTSLDLPSIQLCSSGNGLPTPAQVQLPIPGFTATDPTAAATQINAYFEPFEGMLVQFSQALAAVEYFELSRFGSIVLADERLRQFTDQNVPSAAGYQQHLAEVASKSIILDDDNNIQNAALGDDGTADDDPVFYPEPGGFSITNYFRGGDTITNLTGVLDFAFSEWRIRPVAEEYDYTFISANPRTTAPDPAGGSLKVASFNVLNYFTTLENPGNVCGPANLECRGANSEAERIRQLDKIVAALNAMNADIVGLIELENSTAANPAGDGNDPVLESIVNALNAVNPGTYDFIDTGAIGTDAIRVAFIYKTDTVAPTGNFAILDSSVDPTFIDTRNRPALAQTFTELATNGSLTVVVNHLKSKGSGCGAGDDDTTTGQGNCNGTRTAAATALANWLATDPTGSGDTDVLIIGDLNSYRNEEPIVALENAGYTDLIEQFNGAAAYGYLFDGQLGYLDHALANASLFSQVTGVTSWPINADEVNLLDYNDMVLDAGEQSFEQKPGPNPLYEDNAYRSSDHDPIIVGLNLAPTPGQLTVTKVVINDDGGTATVANFTLYADNTQVTSGVPATLAPGTYQISETGPAGYRATFSGDCNAQGVVQLGSGESKSCTLTNNDIVPVTLSIANNVPGTPGGTAAVDITYSGNGNPVSLAIFSIDFDESCLLFDPADANNDNVPDAIQFALPTGFGSAVQVDLNDLDGEIDITMQDVTPPFMSLPDGTLLTIDFQVSTAAACQPAVGSTRFAAVIFSGDPTPSFGDSTGATIPGQLNDGGVLIDGDAPLFGDCNGDNTVNAGDISALILEIFDGDGDFWTDTPGGTFVGAETCDANEDTVINAADISCTVLLIFNGPGACGSTATAEQPNGSVAVAVGDTTDIALSPTANRLFLPIIVTAGD